MLDNINIKSNKVFKYLKSEAKITYDNKRHILREINLSFLMAGVGFYKSKLTNCKSY